MLAHLLCVGYSFAQGNSHMGVLRLSACANWRISYLTIGPDPETVIYMLNQNNRSHSLMEELGIMLPKSKELCRFTPSKDLGIGVS